jgi:hypothetical protein
MNEEIDWENETERKRYVTRLLVEIEYEREQLKILKNKCHDYLNNFEIVYRENRDCTTLTAKDEHTIRLLERLRIRKERIQELRKKRQEFLKHYFG